MRLGKRQIEMLKALAANNGRGLEVIKLDAYIPLVKKGLVRVAYPMTTIFGHRKVTITDAGLAELVSRDKSIGHASEEREGT